jgi:serine/threonine-protein kinase
MPAFEKTEGTGERVGSYRVVRRLATGGTSDVLLAKADGPLGFERSVVLKLLLSQYKHDDEFKGMFAREAAAYARLSHPCIVRLYDFFAHNDQLVMVLEYIDGPPLHRLRGMLKAVGQQFDDATALYVGACVFDALAAAHAATDDHGAPAPVIHRDVNPSNVLIPWDAQVKLADFGIAKVTGANHQSSAGLIKGTYGYMAPEQVKGETVTPRADVYAGAIIVWEMLTKRRAFIRGALPEIEVLRELAEPRILSIDSLRPDLDKSVRDAVKRALEPRAEKRTITAEEMVSVLRAAMPSDEGREKLAKALGAVRHEPKPSATSVPPPMGKAGDEQTTGKVMPRGMLPARPGMLPRPTPAPRPAMGGALRKTAPYGNPAPPPATFPGTGGPPGSPSGMTPRVPGAVPRPHGGAGSSPRLRGNERIEKDLDKTSSPAELARDLAPATEASPLSEPGLASLLEPSDPNPLPKPSSRAGAAAVPLFDNLVEPPELVKATGRESEKLRLGTPIVGMSPGKSIRDAIDEILSNVPSNVPPDLFPKTDPPRGIAQGEPESPTRKDQKTIGEAPRALGHIPEAPTPLDPAVPVNLESTLVMGGGPKAMPSSFPAMNRTLSMIERSDLRAPATAEVARAEKPTERPPPHLMEATTSPMPSVAPTLPALAPPSLSPSTAKMRAFVVPQAALGSAPPPAGSGSSPPATLPLGAMSPPGLPHVAPPATSSTSSTGSQPPAQQAARQGAPASAPGGAPSLAPESTPPKKRGASGLAPVALLLVALAAAVAGVAGYMRWQKSRAIVAVASAPVESGARVATTTAPGATSRSPFVAPESPTGTPPAVPAPSVAASPTTAAPGPAPAPASASPLASAAATAASAAAAASAPAASTATVAPAGDLPPGTGRVKTAGAVPGRRIFVDEKTVGQTPDAVVVKCGSRTIKLGSTGSTQTVDVPCGSEITVSDR